jgi:hypothetical protein
MGVAGGPDLIQDGLVLSLDASDRNSYVSGSTTWFDLSGLNNSGSLTNGPTFSSANLGSIVFDGVNDYVSCDTTSIPNSNNPRTLSVWVKIGTSGNSGYRAIINQGTYLANQQFQIGIFGGSFNINNYSLTWSDPTPYTTNIWYNLSVSYNGSSFTLYKNGSSVTSGTVSLSTVMGAMRLASNPVNLENLNGSISNAQIYNRALSASEVQQNYNAQKSKFGL